MPTPKILGAQRDFSAGELDVSIKRADELPTMKAGARQMANWRILSSKALQNRPGRSALFQASGRTEEIQVHGGAVFFLNFGAGSLKVFNAAGAQVFSTTLKGDGITALPWTLATIGGIVWAQPSGFAFYITYPDGAPNNVPQVLTWDGVATWTLSTYAETVTGGIQKRTLFFRISPPNISIRPSDYHAGATNVDVLASANVFAAGMVGTRLRYCDKQMLVTSFIDAKHIKVTLEERLPQAQILTVFARHGGSAVAGDVLIGSNTGAQGIAVASDQQQVLNTSGAPVVVVGDQVTGGTSGAIGIVNQVGGTNFNVSLGQETTLFVASETVTNQSGTTQAITTVSAAGNGPLVVQIIPNASGTIIYFSQGDTSADTAVGPNGQFVLSTTTPATFTNPQFVGVWDDEVMNSFRGYPSSVFADQSRLGFDNFPSVPSGIAWSAIGLPLDLFVGALADNAIFELAPDNSQVLYVVAGMESSEFVFTDRAIYYIPITPTFPLQPGSVAFNKLSDYGCMPGVQPRRAEQSIIYIKAGAVQVGAVQAPGAYYRPYVVDHISEMHSHLFTASNPIAIAVPSGPTQFEEQYLYIALANGSLVVGRYAMRQGLLEPGPEGKPAIGWVPWNNVAGTISWVAARQGDVIFTSSYSGPIVERLDDTQYLDAALFVNNLPPALTPPGGKGPLYKFPGPNTNVFLIDLGTRFMGQYGVDSNGFIIPQFIGGENLASPQLIAGLSWTAMLEPFAPDAQPGQDVRQRMLLRRVSRMGVYVSNSTGFVLARLFSGPITPTSPPLGTMMNRRRIPMYNVGDDATQPAPLREEMQRWRPLGRSFDPRMAVIKDTPGPLLVHEIGMEVSI